MNRIVKNTLYLYSRQLFTLFLSLYTARLTLQVLGVIDFGIFAAVGGVTAILSIVTSSLSNSTQRYLTFSLGRHDYELLNRTYISSIEIHIGLSLFLLLLAETIGLYFFYSEMEIPQERLTTAFWVYQFSILSVIINILTAPHYAEIVSHEDMGVLALFAVTDSIIKLLSVIVLFYITLDKLLAYSFLVFVVHLLNRTMMAIYCKLKYEECQLRLYFNKKLCKSMLNLTSWNFISNLGIMGFSQGTVVLLNVFFGTAINAAYNISFQAYFGIRNFTSSFQLASNPQIIKLYSEGKLDEMRILLTAVCKFSFFLVFILSFPVIINSELILSIWLKDVPDHAQYFFILLLLFSYFEVMGYPLDIAAQATGKVKTYSIIVCCSYLSILFFSYIAFSVGAIPEAILYVSIIISIISIVLRVVVLSRTIDLSLYYFLRKSLVSPFVVMLIVCPILIYIKFILGNISVISSIVLFLSSFVFEAIVIYMVGLEKKEKEMIFDYIHNFLLTIKKC